MASVDFTKPEPKKIRTYSLSPETIALVDQAAESHGVSASRIVDIALDHYLTHVLTLQGLGGKVTDEN